MNLFTSILTTIFIVLVFWSLALFQKNIAHAIESETTKEYLSKAKKVLNTENRDEQHKSIKTEFMRIAGVKKTIPLTNIKSLWQSFHSDTQLHSKLKNNPDKIYVIYQKLTSNYQQAEVTIGYQIDDLTQAVDYLSLSMGDKHRLLPKKRYTDEELATAWSKINYSKKINFVVEIHHLDPSNNISSSQVFVTYH